METARVCQFPAKQLLLEQRRVCAEADRSKDLGKIRAAAEYVRKTHSLRLQHEDMTGCQCWIKTVLEESGHAANPSR